MSIIKLENQIKEKKSFLCIGLDIDLNKIPNHLMEEEDPIFSFAKDIIDSTNKFAVAYKPNIAFFEAYGLSGWKSLEKIIKRNKKLCSWSCKRKKSIRRIRSSRFFSC